jgi:hypothetical protein
MHFLTQWARVTGGTLLAALQAPMPDVVALFDDTLLLADGLCLYAGPARGCLPHFQRAGYALVKGMSLSKGKKSDAFFDALRQEEHASGLVLPAAGAAVAVGAACGVGPSAAAGGTAAAGTAAAGAGALAATALWLFFDSA